MNNKEFRFNTITEEGSSDISKFYQLLELKKTVTILDVILNPITFKKILIKLEAKAKKTRQSYYMDLFGFVSDYAYDNGWYKI